MTEILKTLQSRIEKLSQQKIIKHSSKQQLFEKILPANAPKAFNKTLLWEIKQQNKPWLYYNSIDWVKRFHWNLQNQSNHLLNSQIIIIKSSSYYRRLVISWLWLVLRGVGEVKLVIPFVIKTVLAIYSAALVT